MEDQKTQGQKLQEELTWTFPNIGKEEPKQIEETQEFCRGYMEFLDRAKTERECVIAAGQMLRDGGYTLFEEGRTYAPGDKVYRINRGKALIAVTFGRKPLEEGIRISGAHVDAPRLDLKPSPMFEKNDLAYFKTHYYGAIRKYQWGVTPLSLHGVVIRRDGETVEVRIGEEPGDPVFCITDLLPHLAAEQDKRSLKDGLKGEELNVLIGSLPYIDEAELKSPVKLLALKLLHDKYGITEGDFFRAELELVPAYQAHDVGLDRSMIGAYGQDDRVCAYTALQAEIRTQEPEYTTLTILADKEEIGSTGNTGLESRFVLHVIEMLAGVQEADVRKVLQNSLCLSADVNAAFDPSFPKVYDASNSCYLNKGCVLTKYTGARGKSSSNDASAETMARVIRIMEQEGVYWQAGELGAVDVGGGNTIAKFIAHLDVDVVDLGVPILSMHSPFELSSKLDVYNTYKAFLAFYK